MKVLVDKDGKQNLVFALLIDRDLTRFGRTFDDALYNLQAAMAEHVIDAESHGIEHVWAPIPAAKAYYEAWDKADPQMHCEHVFRFEGKEVELPSLEVRVVGDDYNQKSSHAIKEEV